MEFETNTASHSLYMKEIKCTEYVIDIHELSLYIVPLTRMNVVSDTLPQGHYYAPTENSSPL